jgi:hypothetical protein
VEHEGLVGSGLRVLWGDLREVSEGRSEACRLLLYVRSQDG